MVMYYPLFEHASAKTTWYVMTGSPESKKSFNTANVLICSGSYPPEEHRKYTDVCYRISKQELASPGGIVMVRLKVPPPVIVRTYFGRGRSVARGLATRTPVSVIAATVIQMTRMPMQGGV
ncbi:hypothetical protein AVEN_77875-1 [Araneus ventricosus]|uniref:Uncharacterized protein n=1 Tax=Araneus ventricosus TaxID=182803 RepID=A0A4Y2PMR8_ARAVE|nr:hypothetical protein AVEN_77875-1 [Araneus ventricosus]